MLKRLMTALGGASSDFVDYSTHFGRYSDAHKSLEKYDSWTRSIGYFGNQNYLQAYLEFLNYLQDDETGNVTYHIEDESDNRYKFLVKFVIQQGSKIVRGYANAEEFVAEVQFVRVKDNLHIALGRKLMEMNYDLLYSGFSMSDDGVIWLRFTTNTLDSFAGKLYNGLREIATRSDAQDDILLKEFQNELLSIDDKHITILSEDKLQHKVNFFRKWVKHILEDISKLHSNQKASVISYMLLVLIYRLDYLLCPEGTLTAKLEQIHKAIFNTDSNNIIKQNTFAIEEFEKLLQLSDEELQESFYTTKSTFGIAKPAYQREISEVIDKQLSAIHFFEKNDLHELINLVFEYIPGYLLYNFGLPRPAKSLMHLYIQLIHQDFFEAIEIPVSSSSISKSYIQPKIESVLKAWQPMYPNLPDKPNKLSYKSFDQFSKDFFVFIRTLDYNS